jgi:hypothetical protein
MNRDANFFKDAGPVILRLEQRSASWTRLHPEQFRRLAILVGAGALVMALLVWGRVRVLANGYQIGELKGQRDALLAEHRRLERRLDEMQSLHYVETAARQRLGMVDINPNQVINLRRRTAAQSLVAGVKSFFGGDGQAKGKAK